MESEKKKPCVLCKLFKNVFIFTFGVVTGALLAIFFV